jgi:hypothetical protein
MLTCLAHSRGDVVSVDSDALSNLPAVLRVLTVLIAPALMITACASFVASTSGRLGMNINRARDLAKMLRELQSRDRTARHTQLGGWLELELNVTYRRVRLEQQALALAYAATILFLACSFVLGMEAIEAFLHYWLPVALGMCGVLCLLVASALLILDVRLMLRLVRREVAIIRSDIEEAH